MLLIDLILQSTLAGMIGNVISKCSGGLWGFTQPDNATIEDIVSKLDLLLKAQGLEKEQVKDAILGALENATPSDQHDIQNELQDGIIKRSEQVLLTVLNTETNIAKNHNKSAESHNKVASKAAYHLGILSQFKDYSKAAEYMEEAIELDSRNFSALNHLGNLYRRFGKMEKAEQTYNKILTECEDPRILAKVFGNLGLFEKTRGNYQKAETHHQSALDIHIQRNNQKGMARQYGNLGLLARRQNQIEAARKLHKKALELNFELNHPLGIARQSGNLGMLERKQNNLDKAEEYTNRALNIHKELDRRDGVARQYDNLGLIEIRRGNFSLAETYLRRSLDINIAINRHEGKATQYAHLGFLKQREGHIKEAKTFFEKSLEIAIHADISPRIRQMQTALNDLKAKEVS